MDDGSATLGDDLLSGADQIAAFTYGLSQDERVAEANRRRIYHLVEKHGFPGFKFGGVLSARKSKIMEWVEAQEAAQARSSASERAA